MAAERGGERTWMQANGVTISLRDVVGGGREGILNSLRDQIALADDRLREAEARVADRRDELEQWELEAARARAQGDAARLAYDAAQRAFADG